jgi:hypothetical protein
LGCAFVIKLPLRHLRRKIYSAKCRRAPTNPTGVVRRRLEDKYLSICAYCWRITNP